MHNNLTGIAQARIGLALASVLLIAGCSMAPMGMAPRATPSAPPPPVTSESPEPLPGSGDPSASGAEQACMAAGRERGLDVVGVVGSRAVSGNNGEAARDVMLRVRRSGAEIEVRCNYVAETSMARIMLI